MSWLVRFDLWREKRKLAPRAVFKRSLRKTLIERFLRERGQKLPWYQTSWSKVAFASVLGLMVVSSFTTAAYAYSSPEVTSGTALYGVKQTLETVEEKLQRTPEQKAAFYLKQINRREAERAVMKKKNQQLQAVDDSIRKTTNNLAAVEDKLSDTDDGPLKAAVQNRLQKQKERLEEREKNLEDHLDTLEGNTSSTTTTTTD